MIKTTFTKLFYTYDYTDFYNENYEMDKDISLDKYTVVFVNKDENKLIIVSDGLHFRPDGYTKLFPFLFDKNNYCSIFHSRCFLPHYKKRYTIW